MTIMTNMTKMSSFKITILFRKFFLLVKKAIQGGAGNTQQLGGILLISIRLGQGCGNIGRIKLVSLFYGELKGEENYKHIAWSDKRCFISEHIRENLCPKTLFHGRPLGCPF